MAKAVNDVLTPPSAINLDDTSSTFGTQLSLPPRTEPQAVSAVKRAANPPAPFSKSAHPPKIKPKNLRAYLLYELSCIDEAWTEAAWQYEISRNQIEQSGEDCDIEESLRQYLVKLEGEARALFQLGRYFGLTTEELYEVMPNMTKSEYEDDTLIAQQFLSTLDREG